jgi:hypothetical protein
MFFPLSKTNNGLQRFGSVWTEHNGSRRNDMFEQCNGVFSASQHIQGERQVFLNEECVRVLFTKVAVIVGYNVFA